MKAKLLRELDNSLLREEGLVSRLQQSRAGQNLSAERKTLNDILRRVLASRNLDLIIEVETALVEQDLEHYANSRSMEKSLHTGFAEMQAVTRHLKLVTDKARYCVVDQLHNIARGSRPCLWMMRGWRWPGTTPGWIIWIGRALARRRRRHSISERLTCAPRSASILICKKASLDAAE